MCVYLFIGVRVVFLDLCIDDTYVTLLTATAQ